MPSQQNRIRWGLSAISLAVLVGAGAYVLKPGSSNASAGPTRTDEVVLSDAQVREASAGQNASVQEMLKDGRLSFDEYRGAFLSFVACAESHGGKAEGPPTLTRRGKLEIPLLFPAGDAAVVAVAVQGCKDEQLSMVDSLWSMHVAPAKEELQHAREALAACLRSAGFPNVPGRPAPGELLQFWPGHGSDLPATVFFGCQEQIDHEYDLPGFGG